MKQTFTLVTALDGDGDVIVTVSVQATLSKDIANILT